MNSLPDEEPIYYQRQITKHNANKWRRGLDPRDPDHLEDDEGEEDEN